MIKITKSTLWGIIVAVLAIFCITCLGSLVEDVPNEEIVVNQVPITGTMEVWSQPGMYFQEFGNTTHYYKTQQLWFGSEKNGEPIPVIFNDASDGMIYGSLRVKLPTDTEHMLRIQTDYNGMDRLMNDLVRPTVTKVIYASGPLMSAFESYAEKKNDLIEHITDQLNNGVYKTTVHEIETTDPLTGEVKKTKVAALIPDENAAGGYRRSEKSPFAYYGLEISQVAVSKIAYSEKVNAQIAQQQEANMLVQTSKAKSAAAQQEAIRAEEEGKAAAAKARWEQEKLKATAVTQAEQEREVSRLAAEKAEYEKKRIIAEGEAQAAANRALVSAGLTPLEKATIDKETAIGIAHELANSNVRWVPEIIMGGNGNSNNAMDAVGLNMMLDVVNKMKK